MTNTFIITGGNFKNKGAQAMVFAVVQELKNNYPESDIWVFSSQVVAEKKIYNFNVLSWDSRLVKRLLLGKLKIFTKTSLNYKYETKVSELLNKADAIFDVSGFALSAQFRYSNSLNYLFRIALAKKYKRKLYLLPQSFGPFNYKRFISKAIIFPLLYHYLKYPEMIYPRENQGYDLIRKFTKNNVKKALDIVLLTDKPKQEIVFKKITNNKIEINKKAVAIIPNSKLILWNTANDIYQLYGLIINELLKKGYKIYLLRHSNEDLEFCFNIAGLFNNEPRVTVLADDYNCIELSNIIMQMEFVVASRYHSLIHAYKSGLPAVVIGWAQKYPEIMAVFEQKHLYFDIREIIDKEEVVSAIDNLADYLVVHKDHIINNLKEITKNPTLNIIVNI